MTNMPPSVKTNFYNNISQPDDYSQAPPPSALPAQLPLQDGKEKPPPYTTIDLQRYHNVLDESSSDLVTDRLRRLITFSLSVDYQLTPIENLPRSDWTHWIRLRKVLLHIETRNSRREDSFSMKTRVLWLEYLHVHIRRPADTLQVPSLIVKTMILLLPLRYSPDGQPTTVLRRYSFRGPDVLAAKLAIDRDVIIDAAVCCDLKRKELKDKLQKAQELYFLSLDGPQIYELSEYGKTYVKDWNECRSRVDSLLPPELETMRSRCIVRAKYAIYMCVPKWLIG